ncbi:MAG TPA: hypothetical protein PKZ25_12620, partial [Candidatus Hydrogenedentes bacterium]|nr:hypothetical protein [Candidatus Hydrogenedentota bacterium]
MHVLRHVETLVYYDGVQLFLASDQLDLPHLCLLVEQRAPLEEYLCIPVSQRRLNDFLSGRVDLLTLIKSAKIDELLIGDVTAGQLAEFRVRALPSKSVRSEWLPEPGFFFEKESTRVIGVARELSHAADAKPPLVSSDITFITNETGKALGDRLG